MKMSTLVEHLAALKSAIEIHDASTTVLSEFESDEQRERNATLKWEGIRQLSVEANAMLVYVDLQELKTDCKNLKILATGCSFAACSSDAENILYMAAYDIQNLIRECLVLDIQERRQSNESGNWRWFASVLKAAAELGISKTKLYDARKNCEPWIRRYDSTAIEIDMSHPDVVRAIS